MSVDKRLEKAHFELLIEAEEQNFVLLKQSLPMADFLEKEFNEYIETLRMVFESTGIVPSIRDIKTRIPSNKYLKVMESIMRRLAKVNGITEIEIEDIRGRVNKSIKKRTKNKNN